MYAYTSSVIGGGGGARVSVSPGVTGKGGCTDVFASFTLIAFLRGAVAGTGGRGGGGGANSFETFGKGAVGAIASSDGTGGGGGGGVSLLRCVAAFAGAVVFFAVFCACVTSPKQMTANVASDNFSFML
jgi:hypothetical protein